MRADGFDAYSSTSQLFVNGMARMSSSFTHAKRCSSAGVAALTYSLVNVWHFSLLKTIKLDQFLRGYGKFAWPSILISRFETYSCLQTATAYSSRLHCQQNWRPNPSSPHIGGTGSRRHSMSQSM